MPETWKSAWISLISSTSRPHQVLLTLAPQYCDSKCGSRDQQHRPRTPSPNPDLQTKICILTASPGDSYECSSVRDPALKTLSFSASGAHYCHLKGFKTVDAWGPPPEIPTALEQAVAGASGYLRAPQAILLLGLRPTALAPSPSASPRPIP